MLANKLKNQRGFTIIEVLIVLAIAGLIVLILFLAVPPLQRMSRNNGRTSDVSRISAAVNEFVANNQGQVFVAGGGNANLASVLTQAGTLSQITVAAAGNCGAAGAFCVTASGGATVAPITTDSVRVVTGGQCDTATVGQVAGTTSTKQMAIQWQKEGAGGKISVCTNI